MKDRSYKVALMSLRADKDTQEIIMESLNLVKDRKIRNINEFLLYLDEAGVSKKKFTDTVIDIIDDGDSEEIIQLGTYLGNKWLNMLQNSWWERNLPDETLKKIIPPKEWSLFRDNRWLTKNKVLKY